MSEAFPEAATVRPIPDAPPVTNAIVSSSTRAGSSRTTIDQ
jgi:hypothetical protein